MKFEGSSAISKGLGNALQTIAEIGSLPMIRGKWFFVDPEFGADTSGGKTVDRAVASLDEAYGLAVDGDGIAVLSYGSASADTTTYLKQTLTWAKNGITVVGIAAPVSMFGRARIAGLDVTTSSLTTCAQTAHTITREAGSFITDGWEVGMKGTIADSGANNNATFTITDVAALTITVSETLNVQSKAQTVSTTLLSYITDLISVSGQNNRFYNLHFYNGGASAYSYGCGKVTGNRNYFYKCHFAGAVGAAAATTNDARAIDIEGQENEFDTCTFGTDTVLWSGNGAPIKFDGGAWRTKFVDCDVTVYSATAGTGGISIADATAISGYHEFKDCIFKLWNENGVGASTAMVIGTKPTSGQLLFVHSGIAGWSAWGAAGMSGCIYLIEPTSAASAAGGIATTL